MFCILFLIFTYRYFDCQKNSLFNLFVSVLTSFWIEYYDIEYCERCWEMSNSYENKRTHQRCIDTHTHANTPIVGSCLCLENECIIARRTIQSKAKQNKIIYTHIIRTKRESENEKVLAIERDKQMHAILTSVLKSMLCEYCVKETTIWVHISCACICICIHSVIQTKFTVRNRA